MNKAKDRQSLCDCYAAARSARVIGTAKLSEQIGVPRQQIDTKGHVFEEAPHIPRRQIRRTLIPPLHNIRKISSALEVDDSKVIPTGLVKR
jgi:hypothetical protein